MTAHPSFTQPSSVDVPIWRYMDFTKYVAMLAAGGLYFSRADQLGDPFEGSSPVPNVLMRQFIIPEMSEEGRQQFARVQEDSNRIQLLITYVSCWHANETESAAMWRLYAKSTDAIAIRSTFRLLRDLLPDHYHAGEVHYIDYQSDHIPEGNGFNRLLRKRKSFEHEREIRAMALHPNLSDSSPTVANPELGKWVTVDLSRLIDCVYVAPTTPDWYLALVRTVTQRFGYGFPIERSSLDTSPIY